MKLHAFLPSLTAGLLLLLSSCLIWPSGASCQNRRIDSMENDLKHPRNDTFRLDLLINLADEYYGYDTVKGMQYLERVRALAEKMHYLFYVADYYQEKAKLVLTLHNDVVIPLLDTAIRYYEKFLAQPIRGRLAAQARLSIATCKGQKGVIMAEAGQFKEAIAAYMEALQAWKDCDEPEKNAAIATYYGSISTVYYDLKEPDKALEYDEAAIPYRVADGNEEFLAMAYIYVGDDMASLSRNDSALFYLEKARPFVERVNKPNVNITYYSKRALVSRNLHQFQKAIDYYEQAIAASYAMGNLFKPCSLLRATGECYELANDYLAARATLLKALKISIDKDMLKEKLEILRDLARIEGKTHHEAIAFRYLMQADQLSDSLKKVESKAAIAEIENKYQAAEKEKEIIQLQGDKALQASSLRQQSILNRILSGSIGLLLVLAFLLYRNYRQKQQLQLQRIGELEKDRQLMAVKAMLKGQEEERSRLAKDLHDGLGGMLSGVKYSLGNMKGNLIVTPDNMAVYERSLDMIDSSIRELRRVAHNMMPEMLMRFGLDEALKDYCHSIGSTGVVAVQYQSFGMSRRADHSVEIIVYRIVQELLNNILKHASATQVLVQLVREGPRLSVVVEDDGRGFATDMLENSRGAGWTNIRSRVDYLKGKVEVHSEVGKGTSVTMEFNL
ncbi:MAG: tetratricopeptide repeat protein [Bacteroidota bacterium]|nr:tetratricopeptide repeat protein [Bacteroidota bacterium]